MVVNDYTIPLEASESSTLGQFWGHLNGVLRGTKKDWVFEGDLQYKDTYDFDHHSNQNWYSLRNVICFLNRSFLNGTDYSVTSVKARVRETSNGNGLEWSGAGRISPYHNYEF